MTRRGVEETSPMETGDAAMARNALRRVGDDEEAIAFGVTAARRDLPPGAGVRA